MLDTPNASRADTMAREIELSVSAGKFQPNDFIGTKEDLEHRFNVSRGTLNEAIRLLRSRSIIKVKPGVGGGIFVAETSPIMKFGNLLLRLHGTSSFAEGTLQVKDALDPAIAVDAALHRSKKDVADLFAIIDEMARGSPTATESVQLNWKLHRRIGEITPNAVLRSLYVCLMDLLSEELVEAISRTTPVDQRMEVHMKLVEAIAAGDTGAASYWGGERHRFAFGGRAAVVVPSTTADGAKKRRATTR